MQIKLSGRLTFWLISILISLIWLAGLHQTRSSSACTYLPNGCKYHSTYSQWKSLYTEIFVCDTLEKSFLFERARLRACKKNQSSFTDVYFKLAHSEILDNRFKVTQVYNFIDDMNPNMNNDYQVRFKNLKGFDLNSTFFMSVSVAEKTENFYVFDFYFSKFAFYLNRKRMDSCDEFANAHLEQPRSLFQIAKTSSQFYQYGIYLNSVKFEREICIRHFRDVSLKRLFIQNMPNTYYRKSVLKFDRKTTKISSNLNSTITELWVYGAEKIDLDLSLLDPDVFAKLARAHIHGEINSIHGDSFKPLTKLRLLFLEIIFFERLVGKGIDWIRGINDKLNVNLTNRTQLKQNTENFVFIYLEFVQSNRIEIQAIRLFPDEDFCLFKDFPFNQLVVIGVAFFIKYIQARGNTSCTIRWLNRYLDVYVNSSELGRNYFFKLYYSMTRQVEKLGLAHECDFENMLRKCAKQGVHIHLDGGVSIINDIKESSLIIEYVIFIALLVISSIGILTNSFIVFMVNIKENQKYINKKQYVYIGLVSIANLLILTVYFFQLVWECQLFDGIYCSPIRFYPFSQYFRIIYGEFLSTVYKLVTNFAYVGFSISRLSLIGNEHSKFIKFFSELSVLKYMIVSCFLSFALSTIKIFRFVVNTFDINQDYPTPYHRNYNKMFSKHFYVKARAINILNAFTDFLNFIGFVLVNLVLDICMVVKLKKTLSEKLNVQNYETIVFKAIVSVILLVLFNMTLKLPGTLLSILDSIHLDANYNEVFASSHIDYLYETYCMQSRLCPLFEKLASLLFAISISSSVVFHYKFDKRFKIGLRVALSKLFSDRETHQNFLKKLEEPKGAKLFNALPLIKLTQNLALQK